MTLNFPDFAQQLQQAQQMQMMQQAGMVWLQLLLVKMQ
jgi:hypothetical protein